MSRPDHNTYREWLTLDADSMLDGGERALLDDHLSSCADCRRERDENLALDALLQRSTLPVRADFRESVISALPTAGWEARSPRAWRFTAAVIVLLGALAAALMAAGSAPASSGLGTLAAVGGMLQAAVVAGAGLLGASWKGIGMVVDKVIASPVSLGAFGFLVLCLNLFLVSLIRRKRPADAAAAQRSGRNP
ncbi:MAG TPA: zf-HC2 domain-containing protein [Thermoanaerobaculia bacterium]|nr:zf-HC2 domain-containing protein [Thermoanaerobaculia bacterium]